MHSSIASSIAGLLAPLLVPLVALAQGSAESPVVIEQMQCRGNQATSCAYILSHVQLAVGDTLDEEEVRNARFRLSALTNFASVRIFLEKGSERGKASLVVQVVEATPRVMEALIGLANQGSTVLAGRIGEQNLFGEGERLDLTALKRIPLDGPLEVKTEFARLQYVDPNLFTSTKYFLVGGVAYFEGRFSNRFGDVLRTRQLGLDVSIGRRIADFSFISFGYAYLPTGKTTSRVTEDGQLELETQSFSNVILLDYGWNSEDDPYFPTQGSRFRAGFFRALKNSRSSSNPEKNGQRPAGQRSVAYRKTWTVAQRNFLSFNLGAPGSPFAPTLDEGSGLTIGYARSLDASGLFSGVQRGRWYLDGGIRGGQLNGGRVVNEARLRAGLRMETRFGIGELYVLAAKEL